MLRPLLCSLLLLLLLAPTACAPAEPDVPAGPPEGWQAEGDRWWRAGVDTARAFRNLEDLGQMGVAEGSSFELAVKNSLIELFRNDPERIDSLFARFVAPKLAGGGDVEAFKREGYGALRTQFREPRTAKALGADIPVPYPDSLRQKQVSGAVRTQVYLDAEGQPQAVEVLEGVHPVLDAIALRATTEMRWSPAYHFRNGSWQAQPAWVRFNVRFAPPGS